MSTRQTRSCKVRNILSYNCNDDSVSKPNVLIRKAEKRIKPENESQPKKKSKILSRAVKTKGIAKKENGIVIEEEGVVAHGSKTKEKVTKEKNEKKAIVRTFVKKGAAAVDGLCLIANTSHVYCEDNDTWDCLLNQTNIQFNNNKYYIIQLLKDDNKEVYSVWMRWGRVGLCGQNSLKPFGSNLLSAKNTFTKKFFDKTKNDWECRDTFDKVPGKYDLLKVDYSEEKEDAVDGKLRQESKPVIRKKKVESKLEISVKLLIELICDIKAMEDAVVMMDYDANKAPLGKLTEAQVKAGFLSLKKIDNIINGSGKSSNKLLLEACNSFYTRIPHYFGMRVPPLIQTKAQVREKMSLLEALVDIQAAMTILNQPIGDDIHPTDQHYDGLNCDIHLVVPTTEEYKLIERYLTSTHGATHSMYKIHLEDIFKVSKNVEVERFKDLGNRMLLWHGSRLTNWAGILSQGLRIAPPEAPTTGYMFGKGIYFADVSSKSANYCMPSMLQNIGLLVLCEVSLGKCNELVNANYEGNKLPKGCHSVKGLGRTIPDPRNSVQLLPIDTIVPLGPTVNLPDCGRNNTLQYNEYVVYDVAQVKIKYLLKVKFTF